MYTTHVSVAVFVEKFQLQGLYGLDLIVILAISTPGFRPPLQMGMNKNHIGWEVVEVIDDESKLCHSLPSFVDKRMESCFGLIVHMVDS